jgi:ABC-2 type transport system permease protein
MTFGSYIGLIILIAAFSGIGILASSLSQNQIMAYLLGVFMCFIMYFGIEQLASYKLWAEQIISFRILVFTSIFLDLQED